MDLQILPQSIIKEEHQAIGNIIDNTEKPEKLAFNKIFLEPLEPFEKQGYDTNLQAEKNHTEEHQRLLDKFQQEHDRVNECIKVYNNLNTTLQPISWLPDSLKNLITEYQVFFESPNWTAEGTLQFLNHNTETTKANTCLCYPYKYFKCDNLLIYNTLYCNWYGDAKLKEIKQAFKNLPFIKDCLIIKDTRFQVVFCVLIFVENWVLSNLSQSQF